MRSKKVVFVGITLFCTALFMVSFQLYQCYLYRPYLTVIGYVNLSEGLGRQSVELINAFKDDLSIRFITTRKNKFNDVSKQIEDLVNKKCAKLGKVIVFEDLIWQPGIDNYTKLVEKLPRGIKKPKDQICIAYSMFESTEIPKMWSDLLNNYFDAVAVPDKFLIDVYINSGVKIPIFELPLGLELDSFLSEPLKTQPNNPFVFANFGAYSDRKNHIMLVKAFAKAFRDNPQVLLKINSRYGEKEIRNALTKEITELKLHNVEFTQFSRNKKEYLEQFKAIDCYVSLSKGEGFSIQPREAMALGIPVIATNNTAQSTLCASGLIKAVVSNKLEPALYPAGDYYGYSYNCSEEEVVNSLHEAYENYDLLLQNGHAARKWAAKYQYKNLKSLYRTLIKPKKVILGNENKITSDYLVTNSQDLYNKYISLETQ